MAAPVFPRVHHQQALHHTKGRNLARLLKVSRSGYYKWSHTQQQRRLGNDDRAAFYDDVDRKIHQIWTDSDQVYGAPRITAELAERYGQFLRASLPDFWETTDPEVVRAALKRLVSSDGSGRH